MIGERIHQRERLDAPALDEEELHRSLDDLEAVNRWLGGYRALRLHLEDLAAGDLHVLDVGAGDGATLRHLHDRAPPGWHFVGVDAHRQIVRIARERTESRRRIGMVRGDGLDLPFSAGAFDVVLCTLTLHHFGDAGAVKLLREMGRVCAGRILVNDLERSFFHYLGALLLARTVWRRSPVTRHDGPISVRRSFRPDELLGLARTAGLRDARVHRHFFFRLVLEAAPPASEPNDGASSRSASDRSASAPSPRAPGPRGDGEGGHP